LASRCHPTDRVHFLAAHAEPGDRIGVGERERARVQLPLTVSGVSMAKRHHGRERSNVYAHSSHLRDHFSSMPSSEGLSGTGWPGICCARLGRESLLMAPKRTARRVPPGTT
jgi:hypothetical protein